METAAGVSPGQTLTGPEKFMIPSWDRD